ncbi:SWIM zinc finger family protein [Alicyclobacillus tolerans]|uniref:SWIM zinc finger family protein n=1 Tax=Alicyclobacillus tolerans TaxID=90970 RepID=UPI001F206E0E|nr:SWIM zinc finger family protein [Alicyclobacillus tolerans]MCF8568477.1 SWIM zinc finger family protein [Alicyclobacillus tolerans]
MSYYDGYPTYESVAEKRGKAKRAIEKLKKKNPDIAPIVIEGRTLARTWWGKAWNANLERYSDYTNRIVRGRSYVRHGAVLDLKITSGKVVALVQGSRSTPYKVDIAIQPLDRTAWESITKSCEGKIDSLQELLEGKFPKALSELFTEKGKGLFPTPKQISLNCSCPDYANMCKHVAAVLYGVGARLDEIPALFFVLRDVNVDELVSKAIVEKSEALLKQSGRKSSRVLENDDISAMFGIEIDSDASIPSQEPVPAVEGPKRRSARPRVRVAKTK